MGTLFETSRAKSSLSDEVATIESDTRRREDEQRSLIVPWFDEESLPHPARSESRVAFRIE
jgi:hypothetical protein